MDKAYADTRQHALAALAAGDAQGAFRQFRPVLTYPGQVDDPATWRDAWDVFASIAEPLAGAEFASLARRVAGSPDDLQGLYDLGYQLIEQQLHEVAATVLARSFALAPAEEAVLTELAAAFEGAMRPAEACRFLRSAPGLIERSPLCRYLLAYNSALTGDLDEPRRLLPRLRQFTDPDTRSLTARVEGILVRADGVRGATPLDRGDLRGWHFVLNGGLLLHLFDGGSDPMNGRYAWVQDSVQTCLEGLRRLAAVLETWDARPPRVFVLEDRDSAALALAAVQILSVPAEPWPAGGSAAPGLVPAYDLNTLDPEVLTGLGEHRPGQVLWNHACCWTQDPPFAGDLTTYLYQYNTSPWGQRLRLRPDGGGTEWAPASDAPAEERAAQVVGATLPDEALADLPALLALARAARTVPGEHGPGALRAAGPRRRQCLGSPVPSSRFL